MIQSTNRETIILEPEFDFFSRKNITMLLLTFAKSGCYVLSGQKIKPMDNFLHAIFPAEILRYYLRNLVRTHFLPCFSIALSKPSDKGEKIIFSI